MASSDSQPPTTLDPTTWVDRHGDSLYRFALSRLRDPNAAEEVVQETFLAALGARQQYAGQGVEGAWLLGICKRKIVDFIRRRHRPKMQAIGGDATGPSEEFFDAKGNWRFDPRFAKGRPEASLEREEFWQAYRRCLKGLPQRQADVFTLREIDEMASDEICKQLGITASNLWVLLHRARLRLMRCMKAQLDKWGAL